MYLCMKNFSLVTHKWCLMIYIPQKQHFHFQYFKGHILDYNCRRNPNLGLIELYGNTEEHPIRTINLSEPSLRYSSSKVLRFF